MNIDDLRNRIDRLDEERERLIAEISKRRQDLKRFAGSISENVSRAERLRIEDLQMVLDDVEMDISDVLDTLFRCVDGKELTLPEEELEEMLDDVADSDGQEADKKHMEEKYRATLKELEAYKAEREKKEKELDTLDDLIEATELELDDLTQELYKE